MKIAVKGIFFFSFYLCSCIYDFGDGKLTLINNSSDTVYFKLIWDDDSNFLNSKNLIDTINYISSREIIKPKDSIQSVVHRCSSMLSEAHRELQMIGIFNPDTP